MKCKDCDNFTYGKCTDKGCLGGCEADSKNRTVHMERECILEQESNEKGEKNMKYFEIKEPYYALIKAKTEQECIKTYVENIADDDGSLKEEMRELDRDTALGIYVKHLDGNMFLSHALRNFKDEENALLLVDGSLI